MEKEWIVVSGATGNIGKKLTENLLSQKKKVKVIGRSKERLESLIKAGATAILGSLDDSLLLKNALEGAKAVFVMIPPNYTSNDFRSYQNQVSQAFFNALADSKVE